MFFRDDNKVRINNAQMTTFIGADTKIEGMVISKSSLRIDGTVVGGVTAEGTVVLSESGQIQGNVIADNIVISGVVDGNMQIKDKTNIEPTGEVYGDITTGRILIDEASVFQGKCNMNKNKENEKKRRKQKKEEQAKKAQEEQAAKTAEKPSDKPAEKTQVVNEIEIEDIK